MISLSIRAEVGHHGGMLWNPTIKLSEADKSFITGLSARSKFYVFLRKVRYQLFDAAMQHELETMYSPKPGGNKPARARED
jgi:hypothetical protein